MDDATIYRELQEINVKLAALTALNEKVQRHDEALFGNGHDGLLLRVDRVEQHGKVNRWLAGMALPAALLAFFEWILK